ncbi:hypothetical protein F5B19DRAFT_187447 [Rostrohypoxylon terebratum]|nr:hypothetical protein F5B19DRAFT_187447 [Rostrohypoxylon terebratum]
MVSELKTCSNCAKRVRCFCDGSAIEMSSLSDIGRERERIAVERRRAEEELQSLAGKLTRLRKQDEYLQRRGLEMLKRGLSSIEELERVEQEEKDRAAREKLARPSEVEPSDANVSMAFPVSFSGFGLGPMSPSTEAFLASVGQGSGDENPQADPSNASHA